MEESCLLRAVTTLVALVAPLAAQTTHVVDRTNGPFLEVADAVAVASSGDRIEVHDGGVTPYAAFTVTVGLDIVAVDPNVILGSCTIRDLAPTQAVRLEGFRFVTGLFLTPAELRIERCAGRVHLHRLVAEVLVRIVDSRRVVASDCYLLGQPGYFSLMTPTTSLELSASSIAVDGGQVLGREGPFQSFPTTLINGYPAVTMGDDCRATFDDTIVAGGQAPNASGLNTCSVSQPRGLGQPCFVGGQRNEVVVVGNSVLTPGAHACLVTAYPSAEVATGVVVRIGPNVVVSTGAAPSPLIAIAEPPRLTGPAAVTLGAATQVTVEPAGQRAVLLALGQWPDRLDLPGSPLPLLLGFEARLLAIALPTPGSTVTFPLVLPNVPFLANSFVALQAGTIDAAGTLELSNGIFLRVQ